MTGTYDWNPMPHEVAIKCPECGGFATFEFAEIVRIQLKKDVPYFQNSSFFDYEMFTDSCGHGWHGAIYYPAMHGGSVDAITGLPDGYSPENWSHSKYLYRGHGLDIGSIRCSGCKTSRKHTLSWPEEAHFSIMYKGKQLWAFDRESTIDLRDYIAGNRRIAEDYKWSRFLLHIPTSFKKQGARERVVKQLNGLLS